MLPPYMIEIINGDNFVELEYSTIVEARAAWASTVAIVAGRVARDGKHRDATWIDTVNGRYIDMYCPTGEHGI